MDELRGARLHTFEEAKRWLAYFALQQKAKNASGPNLERIRALLNRLGNPQEQLRIIHVAGTSGKGSTASAISSLLQSLGWRVGLHVSPHIFDVRERMQIGNEIILEERFVEIVNEMLPALRELEFSRIGLPTYFEILVAMSYLLFVRESVDVAVMETGMGGRFDATNTVEREDKISVVTNIGFDHTAYLGTTLRQIAWEKTGIIHAHNRVFSAEQRVVVRKVIERACREHRSLLSYCGSQDVRRVRVRQHGTTFDLYGTEHCIRGITTNLIGEHQAKNIGLALRVVEEFCLRHKESLDEESIRSAIRHLRVPARFEIRSNRNRLMIFDVAHSPQKIRSLLTTLGKLWPHALVNFVIALGQSSDHAAILKLIRKKARKIILADFCVQDSDYPFRFFDPAVLQQLLLEQGFANAHIVRDNPEDALDMAQRDGDGPIVITGYFHFVAAIRRLLAIGSTKTLAERVKQPRHVIEQPSVLK